ncbi:MAG: YheC/YheD family protein [Firmicutes bacterium]|nr:YheC/YheD family protein [Bacillota bacterium]
MKKAFKRPIIGLLLNNFAVNALKSHFQEALYKLNKNAQAAAKANVTLAVFSPKDISFNPDRLNGLVYNQGRKRWETVTLPCPDVLYDRGVGSFTNQKKRGTYVRQELNRRGVIKLNARHYFDKYELYKIISKHPSLSSYLPQTRLLESEADLRDMLRAYNQVYVKALTGRRGREVIKISRVSPHSYLYSYFQTRLYSGRVSSLQDLMRVIRGVIGNRAALVQQAVDLLQINGRIIDLRGELQRNGRGNLETVAILVRAGKNHSPVATHGTSYLFADFFHNRLHYTPDEIARLKNKINNFLVAVYHCMEQTYGPFGEIAIDFGIDTKGKIWFFECNARSRRISLLKAADKKTINRAFLNPMLYAKYLYSQKQ